MATRILATRMDGERVNVAITSDAREAHAATRDGRQSPSIDGMQTRHQSSRLTTTHSDTMRIPY